MRVVYKKFQHFDSEVINSSSIKKESQTQEGTLHSSYIYPEPIAGRVGSEYNRDAHIVLKLPICNPLFENKFDELQLDKKVTAVLKHDKAYYNRITDDFHNDLDVSYDKDVHLVGSEFAKHYLTSARYREYITQILVYKLSKSFKNNDDKKALKELWESEHVLNEEIMEVDFDGSNPLSVSVIDNLSVEINVPINKVSLDKKLDDILFKKSSEIIQLYKLYKDPELIQKLYMESVHVMPVGYRPKIEKRISPLTKVYTEVINKSNSLKSVTVSRPIMEVLFKSISDLYKSIKILTVDEKGYDDEQFRSIKEMLSGKEGHLRGEMYSVRIDLSGRAVIIGNPNLSVNEIELPIEIAIKANEFNLMRRVRKAGLKSIDQFKYEDIVKWTKEDLEDQRAVLGRQPTLTRLSQQSFKIKISMTSKAVALSPLVVVAYNADYDGDQMYVTIAVTDMGRRDVAESLYSLNNLLNPKDGETHVTPRLEIQYGLYYIIKNKSIDEGPVEFVSIEQTLKGLIPLHAKVGDYNLGMITLEKICECEPGSIQKTKDIVQIMTNKLQKKDKTDYINMTNNIVALGFLGALQYCPSVSIIGTERASQEERFPAALIKELDKIDILASKGLLLDKQVDSMRQKVYSKVESLQAGVFKKYYNETGYFRMVDSGARGTKSSLNQIFLSKGMVDKGDGSVMMVRSSQVDQLKSMESFVLAYSGRAGVMSKVLEVSKPGYLANVLAKSAQAVIIKKEWCGTTETLPLTRKILQDIYGSGITEGHMLSLVLGIIKGRSLLVEGKVIYWDKLSKEEVENLLNSETGIPLLSPLTCNCQCCQTCYGIDLSTGKKARIGKAIGINSAQAVSAPSTQLSMNKFKVGTAVQEQDAFEIASSLLFLPYKEDPILSTNYLSPISGTIYVSKVNEVYSNFLIVNEVTGKKTRMGKVSNKLKLKETVVEGESIFKSKDILFAPRDYQEYYGSLNSLTYTSLLTYAVFSDVVINFKHFETLFSALRKYIVVKSELWEAGRHVTHAERMQDNSGVYREMVVSTKDSIKYNKCMTTALLFEDLRTVFNYNVFFNNDEEVTNPIAKIALGYMPELGSYYDEYIED